MKLVYPACFYKNDDGRYSAIVPDLQGCSTFGNDFADAMEMAIDAASGWVLATLEDGEELPRPSELGDIVLEYDNGFVNYVLLNMDEYAEKYGDKAVRKNLTIPAWLNTAAEKHNINFSQILQNALIKELEMDVSR